tara:strand:+ start:247 stop:471 length:225 start_codon:yes stop_codon:yes gene_type:complete
MQVEEIINILEQNYKPDEELIIAWWDQIAFEEYVDKHTWDDHVIKFEKVMDTSHIHDDIKDFMLDPMLRSRNDQ